MNNIFKHVGDIGDIIAAMPVMRHFGGGDIVICDPSVGQARESLKGARFTALKPLLCSQPYIRNVDWDDDPQCEATHDFSNFRHNHIRCESLTHWQSRHMGLGHSVSLEPWISVTPSDEMSGKTLIACSPRYRDAGFNWRNMIRSAECIFVGLEWDYLKFTKDFAIENLPFRATGDFLELARLIAGSKLFIGNQSAPCWVAMAMGHPLIQQVWTYDPNSMIRRPNARFMAGYSAF